MENRNKKRVNIYITEDTDERLRQYAYEQHTTISGVITQMTWEAKVKYEQIKGQCSLNLEPPEKETKEKKGGKKKKKAE